MIHSQRTLPRLVRDVTTRRRSRGAIDTFGRIRLSEVFPEFENNFCLSQTGVAPTPHICPPAA
jgi:hypothetical protein